MTEMEKVRETHRMIEMEKDRERDRQTERQTK